jgi:cytochrome c heme-lyase
VSACPIKHSKPAAATSSGCPVKHSPPPSSSSGCPVKRSSSDKNDQQQQQYNVYSQPIDPKNQMPAVANQLPSPQQKEVLSTERVKSTIPKGGAEDGTTWTYPSPQMFYNALARKQKLGDTQERDIESVVALHNNMNERTWNKVLEWERVLCGKGEEPKLLKFMGRPSDLSPKAFFKHHVLGHPLPFDRHDWTILRSDGTQVRYVIDYYHDDSKAQEEEGSGMPAMHDFDATPSLLVDVRPALDSPINVVDRAITMPYARRIAHTTSFEPMPIMPTSELKSQLQESLQVWDSIQKAKQQKQMEAEMTKEMSEKEAVALAKSFSKVLRDCQEAQQKVNACESEEECARASMDLTLCMAKQWCPLQHSAVVNALQSSSSNEEEYDARVEKALENVSACVANTSQRAQAAKQQYPKAFQENMKQ